MPEWFAITIVILVCFIIFAMLVSEDAKGMGLALFIILSMVLIQLGSKGSIPVFSFWRDGFKELVHYLIFKSN
jgi:hypothetical protein